MGSIFTTFAGQKVKGFMGKEYSVPVYLQFVPGYCAEVIHSKESVGYVGPSSINTIYAVSHIPSNSGKRRQQYYSEDNRYFPLLRNHGDVPSKGDPVLLCTIGKINYYLGPLNTIDNSPTWNDDKNYKKELTIPNKDTLDNTPRGERGESFNFNKESLYSRLQKVRNEDLDYGTTISEVTGDYIIEGRHGNSVRVGSRSDKPYIFISNERNIDNIFESVSDGSLISITSNGTLADHFPSYFTEPINIDDSGEQIFGFTLSSDELEDNTYPIGTIHSDLNNGADIQETIYGYDKNQMLVNSDRITFNSKLDDIFVSSIKDIYIGSGRHLSITSPKSINILSDNVNLGNPNKTKMQPMVLGDELLKVLKDIVKVFSEVSTNPGPGPGLLNTSVSKSLKQVNNTIDKILSTKHKIEQG